MTSFYQHQLFSENRAMRESEFVEWVSKVKLHNLLLIYFTWNIIYLFEEGSTVQCYPFRNKWHMNITFYFICPLNNFVVMNCSCCVIVPVWNASYENIQAEKRLKRWRQNQFLKKFKILFEVKKVKGFFPLVAGFSLIHIT